MRMDPRSDAGVIRDPGHSRGALLFILPVHASRSESVDPFWFTAMGLTAALREHFSSVDVLTPDGLFTGGHATQGLSWGSGSSLAGHLPRPVRIFLSDVRAAMRARRLHRTSGSIQHRRFDVVVQLHRKFVGWGLELARAFDAPFVLKVEALETREEADWGVRRPGWGRFVESIGEVRMFHRADLLLPISTEVDEQLATLGVPQARRHVVPSGVDIDLFTPGPPDDELVRNQHMQEQQRVGWVGGFRPFHGLELLPAFADLLHQRLPRAVLYLVGTGPLRGDVEAEMARRDWVRLVGAVPHQDVPAWIRCFDVAILAAGSGPFHYSPLKLYEYLACGAPVVAPKIGDIGRELVDGRDALLVPAGDAVAMTEAVCTLMRDHSVRHRLSQAARQRAVSDFSWNSRAASIVGALRERTLI